MTSTHLDMNQIIQQELQERRARGLFKGNKPNVPAGVNLPNITINGEGAHLNADHGPQQVESLLRYVVDYPLDKAMSDAEDDTDAVRHLRMLKG